MSKLGLPCYDLEDVPVASKDMSGSVIVRLEDREQWVASLSEMLLLCNEAASRRIQRFGFQKNNSDGTQTKPLGLEYMADRLDTDDPIYGYQVRTEAEGWLQGFITMTTFTVWQRAFRWHSLAPEAGIHESDMTGRNWDHDNKLAEELDQQVRSGDPDGEGIIWPHVAELSLLGGLGCGSWLVRLVIEELEKEGKFEYLIVQATDNSVAFYESFDFIRVGAVAKYSDDDNPAPSKLSQAANKRRLEFDDGTLPSWMKNKRVKFVVGSTKGKSAQKASPGKNVQGYGAKGMSPGRNLHPFKILVSRSDRKVRLFQVKSHHGAQEKLQEYLISPDLISIERGQDALRFIPYKVVTEEIPLKDLHTVQVVWRKVGKGKRRTDFVEIVNEKEEVERALQKIIKTEDISPAMSPTASSVSSFSAMSEVKRLWNVTNGCKSSKSVDDDVDWNDHSEENVALRRAAGYVGYCHWTFPEQSVEDLYPSYMMARRLIKRSPPAGGAMETLKPRMQANMPPKKVTREPDVLPETKRNEKIVPGLVNQALLKNSMYNKVVTVTNNKYNIKYYYVLHYIVDMDWCHLVPMQPKGVFSGETFRSGRPRYKLVPEGQERELDLPASRCKQVLAYTVGKTNNADKEIWDIVEPHEKEEYELALAAEKQKLKAKAQGEGGGRTPGRQQKASPSKPIKQIQPWVNRATKIMKKLFKHKFSWPFLDPVDPVELNIPDYFEVIKNPMDLQTVSNKLQSNTYNTYKEWDADVLLTFDNAMLYNPADNAIHQLAIKMRKFFEAEKELHRASFKLFDLESEASKGSAQAGGNLSKVLVPESPTSSVGPSSSCSQIVSVESPDYVEPQNPENV